MEKLITLLIKRFQAESPDLFKKIRNWSFFLGLIAATVLALPVSLPGWLTSLLTLIIGITTGLSGASQITVKDEKEILEAPELSEIDKVDKVPPSETKPEFHPLIRFERKKGNP